MFASRHASITLPSDVERALTAAYGDPARAYHGLTHIIEVLRWFDWVGDEVGWLAPDEVYLAVLFHDVVYDPLAQDNETRSAELAHALVGASARTQALIRLTAAHGRLEPGDVDLDAAHFLDCDTAILSAPPDEGLAYDSAIAREYAAVPPEVFRAGRKRFLQTMLDRPRIFLSDLFHRQFDAAARDNLTRLLARY